jgi:hypothetical protein
MLYHSRKIHTVLWHNFLGASSRSKLSHANEKISAKRASAQPQQHGGKKSMKKKRSTARPLSQKEK